MMKYLKGAMASMVLLYPLCHAGGALKARYTMDVEGNAITETVSGVRCAIEGQFAPMEIPGTDGMAWRTDGYTSRVVAPLGRVVDGRQMTARMVFALDTYHIIEHEQAATSQNNVQVEMLSCLDEGGAQGLRFLRGPHRPLLPAGLCRRRADGA